MRTYTCDRCGGTFETDRSDEDAMEEALRLFGEIPPDQIAVVCTDCHRRMMAPLN